MTTKTVIQGRDGYVDHFGQNLAFFRKHRGQVVNENGSIVPQTTVSDVMQSAAWWNKEYERHFARRSHSHPYDRIWAEAMAKVRSEAKGKDPNSLYPDNAWFWFFAVRKLALHLEEQRTTPTKMELIIESINEAVDDRIDDVKGVLEGAGDAASAAVSGVSDAVDAVVETGAKVWTGIKIAGLVGLGLLAAVIVVPPVIRAIRD